jgi:murein DD-endopeptidase MepM/ murein hydrolase activator NlpD
MAKRYTIAIGARSSNRSVRISVAWPWAIPLLAVIIAAPLLAAIGAHLNLEGQLHHLRTRSAALALENKSYRAATAELTAQIAALQAAVSELGARAELPGRVLTARQRRALGKAGAIGGQPEHVTPMFGAAIVSPESTFGLLREVLGALERRLQLVRTDIERQEALAAAIPSIWPAHGWLAASFGTRRDPFSGEPAFHPALDISADSGRPVFATADGIVQSTSSSGAYGNLVVIAHEGGLKTRYAHLSRYVVSPGDRVIRGTVIGYVGTTGRTTGSHLHYEVWSGERPVNPLSFLLPDTH